MYIGLCNVNGKLNNWHIHHRHKFIITPTCKHIYIYTSEKILTQFKFISSLFFSHQPNGVLLFVVVQQSHKPPSRHITLPTITSHHSRITTMRSFVWGNEILITITNYSIMSIYQHCQFKSHIITSYLCICISMCIWCVWCAERLRHWGFHRWSS